jgi:hypothetical protein
MSASKIVEIVEGIAACYAAVPGIKQVYTHQPKTVGELPAVVIHIGPSRPLYPDVTNDAPYGALTIEWTLMTYLLFRDVNPENSETDIAVYLPAVIEALGHDVDAGGSILDGEARVQRFTPVYYTVGKIRYHAVEIVITAIETVAYTYAL